MEISQNFVAFSEYMNFTKTYILHLLTGLEERREALKYLNVLVVQWIQSESLRHKAELEQ